MACFGFLILLDISFSQHSALAADVVIGLSILAYRYEGLRRSDFRKLMITLKNNMWDELGPYHKRPSSKLFVKWVSARVLPFVSWPVISLSTLQSVYLPKVIRCLCLVSTPTFNFSLS